jgi:hypothetical protein
MVGILDPSLKLCGYRTRAKRKFDLLQLTREGVEYV